MSFFLKRTGWIASCWLLFLFAENFPATAASLPQYTARIWQAEDGLPHMAVQAITQTRDGYLWVGTREGLARFDGLVFTPIPLNTKLVQPSVTSLLEDGEGDLWIGTQQDGLLRLRGSEVTQFDKPDGLRAGTVLSLATSTNGILWVASWTGLAEWKNQTFDYPYGKELSGPVNAMFADERNGLLIAGNYGIRRLKDEQVTTFEIESGRLPGDLKTIVMDERGAFWGGGAGGLCLVKDGVMTTYRKGDGPSGIIGALLPDRHGNLWVGTYSGLSRFADGQFVDEPGESVKSCRVFALFQDRENNVWVGSEEGLTQLTLRHFTTYGEQHGLGGNTVRSVCSSTNGSIWIGVWGSGLRHLAGTEITSLSRSNGLSSDYVMTIMETRDGCLWAGADSLAAMNLIKNGEVTHFGRAEGLANPIATTLLEDARGDIWIGTRAALYRHRDGSFARYDTQDGLSHNKINALCAGRSNVVWIGTGSGLTQFDGEKFVNLGATESRLNGRILTLYEDADGALWIGTRGGGVMRFKDGALDSFTSREGLSGDTVYSIMEDDRNNLWFHGSRGIFRVPKRQFEEVARGVRPSLTSIRYGKQDGIVSSSQYFALVQPAACKSTDGRLWFATSQGVVVVDPAEITVNELPPPVVIEEVLADKKVQSLMFKVQSQEHRAAVSTLNFEPQTLNFPPGRGELEIRYTALSLRSPERNRFKYKLDGVDRDWVEAGNRRVAYYNNLAPGNYRFQVIACNNDEVWNETGASLAVVLQPNFWQTTWFLGLMALMAAGTVGSSVWYASRRKLQRQLERLEQQHAIETERSRIARDMHDDLGSRLANILLLIQRERRHQPIDKTEAQPHHAAGEVQNAISAIDQIVWAVNPENDSLANLADYFSDYAQSFLAPGVARCRLDVATNLPDVTLTARTRRELFLAVKEALNNASKYSAATEIWLRLHCADGQFCVTIEDNGRGFDLNAVENGNGDGLRNMRQRLSVIGGCAEFSSERHQGTRVKFIVPLPDNFGIPPSANSTR